MPLSVCRGNSLRSILPSAARPTVIPPSSSRAVRFVDPFGSSDEEAEQSSEDDDRVGLLTKHHISSRNTSVHKQHRSRSKLDHSGKSSTEISLSDLLKRLDRMGYEPTSPSNSPPRSSRSSFSSSSSVNSSSTSSISSLSSGSSGSPGSPSVASPTTIIRPSHSSSPYMASCLDDTSLFGHYHTDTRARSVSPVSMISVESSQLNIRSSASDPSETNLSIGLHSNKNKPKGRSMSISTLPVLHENVDERSDGRPSSSLTSEGRSVDRNSPDRDDWEIDRKRKRRCSAEGRLEVVKEEREDTS